MSRTPATHTLQVVRGATWEDLFTYKDPDGVAINLTGYSARMQVRTVAGRYGTTTAATLVMELTTANGRLAIPDQSVLADRGKISILVTAADTALLNAQNEKKVQLVYSLELYIPASGPAAEYVVPLVEGKIVVKGEVTR
jgi:hypothetical protein